MQNDETTGLLPRRGRKRLLGFALASLLIATLAIGCGGGDDDEDDGGSATPTAAATATSGGGSAPEPTATTAATPTVSDDDDDDNDNSGVTASQLSGLDSYKFTLTMSGSGGPMTGLNDALGSIGGDAEATVTISGAFISPDKAEFTMDAAGLVYSVTVIEGQQWISVGGLTQGPLPATQADFEDALFVDAFWDESDFDETVSQFNCSGTETVNGVEATKCGIDAETYDLLRSQLGGFFDDSEIGDLSTFNFEVWLTDEGVPVRMRVEMEGVDDTGAPFQVTMNMDVTDINGDFDIEAPGN